MVSWARSVAARYHDDVMSHRQSSITLQAQYALARRLVFGPLKARIGLDRAHLLATSAAPIAREVLEFFASLDLPIAEIYGQSEVTGPTSVSTTAAMKLGKLGRPMPGVEVRIADDGEILVRGGNVCLGYFKDPAATAELLQNGWLHSGDVGQLDEDGFLQITGRKKEIIVTSGGKKTAPSNLEGLLKGIDPIGNAMVVGEGRNYLVALLALDPERVGAFAAPAGLSRAIRRAWWPTSPSAPTCARRSTRDVNPKVARFETIKAFEVLPHDFTVEGGELTSTLKVRRKVVAAEVRRRHRAALRAPEMKRPLPVREAAVGSHAERPASALVDGEVVALALAGEHLAGAGDLLLVVGDHLFPLAHPAHGAGDGEEVGEEVGREAHRLVDQARVEIDVRVELALDEVLVLQGDALELDGDLEQRGSCR